MAVSLSSLITATNAPLRAIRCRPSAGTALHRSSSSPGEQDLTSHVDFEAVAAAARKGGATVTGLVGQGEWLEKLGIEARAQALSRANPDRLEELNAALARLCGADEMGKLFKVMAIHAPEWPQPAGFA